MFIRMAAFIAPTWMDSIPIIILLACVTIVAAAITEAICEEFLEDEKYGHKKLSCC